LHQVFTNLYGIQCGTLTNLVTTEPEGKSVLIRDILAHTTYEDIVLASSFQRHGVNEVGWVVNQCTTRSSSDGLLSLFYADGLLSFNPYALRVAAQ
jgi:hypothetical protein